MLEKDCDGCKWLTRGWFCAHLDVEQTMAEAARFDSGDCGLIGRYFERNTSEYAGDIDASRASAATGGGNG